MTAEQHAEKAKQLMRHYFSLAVLGSGQRWDSDNGSEVSDIVAHIIDACTPNRPVQPDALTRIAAALERIADRLDGFSDNIALLEEHAEQIDRLEGKLASAETENHQLNDMLTRIERVIESHDSALYADVVADKTKLSTAVDALASSYRAALAAVAADVDRYDRHQTQLRAELDALRQQLAQVDADNAKLT